MTTRHRVTCLRPYDADDDRRLREALDRAGADVSRVFADPVDPAEVTAWLEGEGAPDVLLMPYHGGDDPTAVSLAAELQRAGGVGRKMLMPVKTADVVAVRKKLVEALSSEARSRLMVQTFDQMTSPVARPILARHLVYKKIGHIK